jgi:4-hydroxyphenylpyruvate dioxygenase
MIEANALSGVGAIHRFVHDLEAERDFFCHQLDFAERGASSPSLDAATHERSLVFQAGDCVVVCTTPLTEDSMSARYLACHPEGVGAVTLVVPDLNHAFERLERAGGNPVDDIRWLDDRHGAVGRFSVATPLDDVQFHFATREGPGLPLPGIDWYTSARGGHNTLRFQRFDHITLNFRTMAPALLWLEHVLGFRRYWEVQLHTGEGALIGAMGSGLRSVVMWDPRSGIKFACNEPVRPNFSASQINSFCDSNRGSGIQHVALLTTTSSPR